MKSDSNNFGKYLDEKFVNFFGTQTDNEKQSIGITCDQWMGNEIKNIKEFFSTDYKRFEEEWVNFNRKLAYLPKELKADRPSIENLKNQLLLQMNQNNQKNVKERNLKELRKSCEILERSGNDLAIQDLMNRVVEDTILFGELPLNEMLQFFDRQLSKTS